MIFIDVGQGDATFIQYKEFDVLIDGGPDDSVVYKLSEYMPLWMDEVIRFKIEEEPWDYNLGCWFRCLG